MVSRGIVYRNCVGDHKTIILSKYISCFYMFSGFKSESTAMVMSGTIS